MTSSEARMRLRNEWGPETVVKCCRLWKTHSYSGTGRCGMCNKNPEFVYGMTWEQADEEMSTNV